MRPGTSGGWGVAARWQERGGLQRGAPRRGQRATPRELPLPALIAALDGCDALIAYRGTAALLAALDSGHLGGAALDVGMAPDQMPSLALARHPRVVATPHIGALTPRAIEHQSLETVAQVSVLLRGKMPPGAVNAADATRVRRWTAFATTAFEGLERTPAHEPGRCRTGAAACRRCGF